MSHPQGFEVAGLNHVTNKKKRKMWAHHIDISWSFVRLKLGGESIKIIAYVCNEWLIVILNVEVAILLLNIFQLKWS